MALIIGPPKNRSLLNEMGTGLGQGLQALLQHKIGQMMQERQQKQTASGLSSLLGIPLEEASKMANLDKNLIREHIRQKGINQRTLEKKAEKEKIEHADKKVQEFLTERRKVYHKIKAFGGNDASREKVKKALLLEGIDPNLVDYLTSEELPEALRSYFFKKARSDPKKISHYAKKYAYKF